VAIETVQRIVGQLLPGKRGAGNRKGLSGSKHFDYELQMAQMNRGLAGIDTLFMPTNPEYSFLASSLVKDIARWGGDVSALVPPLVLKRLRNIDG